MGKSRKVAFPKSAAPGQRPSEGNGALVNCYYEENQGDSWRRVPGLVPFADTGISNPRGALDVNGVLYTAVLDKVVTVNSAGVSNTLGGTLPGALPVTMARNNKAPVPDVVGTGELGPFICTSALVSAYPDVDLPSSVNSSSFLDGFFVFTEPSGRIWASQLNDTATEALSFASASSKPDGLLRGVVKGSDFLAMGLETIEVWQNLGTQPFPLQRVHTIPVGLASTFAVAGFEDGWSSDILFVASDGTVRRLVGYDPQIVSRPDVERAIAAVTNPALLRASVHVHGGHSIWVLTGPNFTWCYDLTAGAWFQRASNGSSRWLGEFSVKFARQWIVADRASSKLLALSEAAMSEDGAPLPWVLEGVIRSFPARIITNSVWFDFTAAQGNPLGSPEEADPRVMLQWSKDGGATWSNSSISKALGREGKFANKVRKNRIGISTHHGIRFRLTVSAPVYVTFRGGIADVELVA